MTVNLYKIVDDIRRDAEKAGSGYRANHERAGGMLSAAARLETALNAQVKYQTGEQPKEGDTVACGGDEFRVDSVDYRRELIKGAMDPTGYAASCCILIKRG